MVFSDNVQAALTESAHALCNANQISTLLFSSFNQFCLKNPLISNFLAGFCFFTEFAQIDCISASEVNRLTNLTKFDLFNRLVYETVSKF